MFVSLLYLDLERTKNSRWDVLCCIKGQPKRRIRTADCITASFTKYYSKVMLSKAAIVTILVVALVLVGLSVPAYMNLELGLENELSTTKGSDLYNYFIDMSKYLGAGPPSYVILNNFQYFDNKNGIDSTSEVLKN